MTHGCVSGRWKLTESTTQLAFPHEEYESGRPSIVSPLYDRLKARGACFGSKLGWERPNWFAPEGITPVDEYSMGRQNWFEHVGAEHKAVRERVGLFDQSSFAKFELRGNDAVEAPVIYRCQRCYPAGRTADLYPDAELARVVSSVI